MTVEHDSSVPLWQATPEDMMCELRSRRIDAVLVTEQTTKTNQELNDFKVSFAGSMTKCLGMLQLAVTRISVTPIVKPLNNGLDEILKHISEE